MRALLVFTFLALLPVSALAQPLHTVRTTCSYTDKARHISLEKKPCVLQETRINTHFAWAIKFDGGPTVTIEYVSSDSGDHVWNINGQPGRGFEISREELEGATDDKNQRIAWFEPD